MSHDVTDTILAELRALREEVTALRAQQALGDDALIPYRQFLRANGIGKDRARRLRREGKLKVLDDGAGRYFVRVGDARRLAREMELVRR